jgi:hypothetical protein
MDCVLFSIIFSRSAKNVLLIFSPPEKAHNHHHRLQLPFFAGPDRDHPSRIRGGIRKTLSIIGGSHGPTEG